jgi:hypothetical protein|tara:strand:+ start:412 stop:513 length:102 start_codon:yes stop_codon:yes gene_type:complete
MEGSVRELIGTGVSIVGGFAIGIAVGRFLLTMF